VHHLVSEEAIVDRTSSLFEGKGPKDARYVFQVIALEILLFPVIKRLGSPLQGRLESNRLALRKKSYDVGMPRAQHTAFRGTTVSS
jgi:hypothetical protein